MKIEKLKNEKLEDFLSYCRKYRCEHDESLLDEDELMKFVPDKDNPTYLLLDNDKIYGVVSLAIMRFMENGKRGRFRIFHCVSPNAEAYKLLFDAIMNHTKELDHMFLFLPETKAEIGEIVKNLNFKINRYSWLLVRDAVEVPPAVFPEGYEIKNFRLNQDEEAWCKVRNAAFATLAGSETPMTAEQIKEMYEEDDYVDGGLIMLWKDNEPIGVIRTTKEVENDKTYAFIGPLAITPEYQGKGLGRGLLRTALAFGRTAGMPYGMLCVNAENDRAADLYLKEDFTKHVVMVNYMYKFK